MITIAKWVHKLTAEDKAELANAIRFDASPSEFIQLMDKLRQKYDFIPPEQPEKDE